MQDAQDLLEGLKRSPKVLSTFVATIPREKMDLRRGPGFWTIAEHVSHLAQVQPMLLERIQRFIAEASPAFVPFIPDRDAPEKDATEPETPRALDVQAALSQFGEYRNRQIHLLATGDDGLWRKQATHPEYTNYSLYILVRHILMHDYWHMYRMEELWLTRDEYLTPLV